MSRSRERRSAGVKSPKPPVAAAPPEAKSGNSEEFGREGTNKTIPEPKPDGAPSEELGSPAKAQHISKTPYTRG